MFLYRLSVMSRRRIFPSPIALAIAAIVASSARTPSSYMRPFATAFVAVVHRHGPSGVTSSRISSRCSTDLNGRHHRGSLENHFYMDGDEDGYIDKRQLEYPHNVNHVHIDNRPHGYRDPQAQMEMPNNVYIDGELHVGGYGPRKKSANDIEPAEAYEILDLPDGCADKTTIKKAYYDLVAKNHPDHNKWMDAEEESQARERLYKINAAFACLRTALQKRPRIRPGYGAAGTSSGGTNWYDDSNGDHSSFFMP